MFTHDCTDELKYLHLKVTPARLGVLRILEQADSPIAVSSIHKALLKRHGSADQATIFRIITTFLQKGLARQLQFNENKLRYEYAYKPEHHHLICERCGTIEDIALCPMFAIEKAVAKEKHFLVKRHSLELFGLCEKCQ